jgi:hypothetical protein
MVLKMDKLGGFYHAPPYTAEEIADCERRTADGPIAWLITRPDPPREDQTTVEPKTPQPPEAPHPAGARDRDP